MRLPGRRKTRAAIPPYEGPRGLNPGEVGPSNISPLVARFIDQVSYTGWWSPYWVERIGAVNRCLQLTAQQVSSMPLRKKGRSPIPQWISNPEPAIYNGIHEAMFVATWSRYARGEAFFYATSRYADGFPATFVVLDPLSMTVDYDDAGAPTYISNSVPLDPFDVLHVRRDPQPGKLRGTGALEAYWSNLASAWSTETFAADAFSRGGVPSSVLKYDKKLTATQAKDLQDQWVASVASRNGAPAVLDQNLDFETLAFSPRDLMLLELREFDTKQIASAFGVPAFLLNMPQAGGLNYSNPSMLFDLWWRSELLPCAYQFSAALSTWFPAGNWCEFDPELILRPALPQLVEAWLGMLGAGVVTANEMRARVLDLPPLEEGEALEEVDAPPGAQANAMTQSQLQAV